MLVEKTLPPKTTYLFNGLMNGDVFIYAADGANSEAYMKVLLPGKAEMVAIRLDTGVAHTPYASSPLILCKATCRVEVPA